MSKLQSAKDNLQKARDLQYSGTRFMLEYRQQVQKATGEVERDNRLSMEGKREAKQEIRKQLGIDFLQKSHTRKQEYVSTLKKAVRDADAVVFAAIKKPDATKVQRFESELHDIKTQLLLTTNAERGYEKLTSFISRLNDPYLAGIVRENFSELSSSILTAPGADAKIRLQLSGTYDQLKRNFETDEVREARDIMELANAMAEDPHLYTSGIVHDSAVETFGAEYGRYIDKTDSFFAYEANSKLKPADYVDEEDAARQREKAQQERIDKIMEEKYKETRAYRDQKADAQRRSLELWGEEEYRKRYGEPVVYE